MGIRSTVKDFFRSSDIKDILDTMGKPVGSLEYDPWGFNLETNKTSISMFKWFYEKYFRVEAIGLENIPAEGRVLLIANHSGQLPIDGIITAYATSTNPHGARSPRGMIERFFPTVPYIGNLLNEVGAVVGDPVNCRKMLEAEEAIVVFPEGVRGSGKPYRKRYQLQRFGTGFMHLALNHKTPIIPIGIVGCEETIPTLMNIKPLAKTLGIPYAPLCLPAVLPAKVIISFGEPMYFDNDAKDEAAISQNVEQVKTEIRALIKKGLAKRKRVF